MCLSPVFVKNKYKNLYGGFDFIECSCRNCSECADVSQMDYLCRSVALYNGLPDFYTPFFCTLTFNEDNLPRTNVYKKRSDGSYSLVCQNVPTFNHTLYRRFRKNFSAAVKDSYGYPVYILTTCEYGEKKHRPHYHCIIFFPAFISWRNFKVFIERFWHYGFTKDVSLACVDGQTYDRKLINRFKYVVKYTTKFASPWLPLFVKDKDNYCTDLRPCDVCPRVFTSNHYGAVLESTLSHGHFLTGRICMQLKGTTDKCMEFSIPSYYIRRHFTKSEIIDKYKIPYVPSSAPYESSIHKKWIYKIETKSIRLYDYTNLLLDKFKSSLLTKIYKYNQLLKKDECFVNALLERFDNPYLSADAFDTILSQYMETSSSLSPLSSFQKREPVKINHYFVSGIYSLSGRYAVASYWRDYNREHGLPWFYAPGIRIVQSKSSRVVPYSFSCVDHYKLLFFDKYMRYQRTIQRFYKNKVDKEYLRLHVLPYIDVA